jgi:DNA topoisomerase-1
VLDRIRALAIPPAWREVWICPDPDGHLQATGRDARGRKVYRYHARWVAGRDRAKYDRLVVFAAALPAIRAVTDRDLRRRGLPRERVLAAMVRLLEATLIRVGNDEYARANRSFGLATLRRRHVVATSSSVRFRFVGKSGRAHELLVRDRRIARVIQACLALGGREVFAWSDEHGRVVDATADDVNAYLRAIADVSTRDFRTWAGTVLVWRALRTGDPPTTVRERKRNVVAAIRETADRLGNTPAVARRSYVHPAVVEAYESGRVPRSRRGRTTSRTEAAPGELKPADEAAVVRLLREG